MKLWELKSPSPEIAKKLVDELRISSLLARLLINRELLDPDQAGRFLFHTLKDLPNPFLLKDMDRAVERILRAMKAKEKIVVYGDYDVDGTTGTSLLLLFFREIGYPVHFYIPNRMSEGYSLNLQAVHKLREQGFAVMITVDNGIAAVKEVEAAQKIGLDVIVTDHHVVPDPLPPGYAVINPLRADSEYPAREICGTGVAFNLVMALRNRLRETGWFSNRPEPNLKKYLDLVALATVADVVPLKGVNRILVRHGLEQITDTAWPGLKALIQVAGIKNEVTAMHLGFYLGPRVNACGRLYDASTGVKLLTSESSSEAASLASELNSANEERKKVEKDILAEALAMLKTDTGSRMSHVFFRENWHPGVIGIVASRIADKAARPVFLLGTDGENLKGSGRSYGGLHLVDALKECAPFLVKFGGHKAAAGVTLKKEMLGLFQDAFEAAVARKLLPEACVRRMKIDAEIGLDEITEAFYQELKLLEPFGEGNPEPLFCLKNIEGRGARIVGEKHLKFTACDNGTRVGAIAFGLSERLAQISKPVDLACSLQKDSFQGVQNLVLHIRDIRPA
ncbi:MAG: single-stranded-DNA-specific exonuclease RecJ [Deltaproteobacteria bacterium]|nr:single-stranded-DNA-specific exonuclease RecJ [Deltaproteobacteria bacterium]